MLLACLQIHADYIYPDSECVFRIERERVAVCRQHAYRRSPAADQQVCPSLLCVDYQHKGNRCHGPGSPCTTINQHLQQSARPFQLPWFHSYHQSVSSCGKIDIHIAEVAAVMLKLCNSVRQQPADHKHQGQDYIKLASSVPCYFHGSEPWTIYARQENCMENFYL